MTLPCGMYSNDYSKDMCIIRTNAQWTLAIIFILLLFMFPLYFTEEYLLNVINMACITLISVLGLNILTGYCGQISIAQSAFMAVGAYASGLLAVKLWLPFWICLPGAGIIAGAVGLAFGLPSLRLRGFYLVMASLAAQFIITFFAIHLVTLTGGTSGLKVPVPHLSFIAFDSERSWYFLIIIITCIMVFVSTGIIRGKFGRAFIAIRDNELAAESMGISLFHYKLLAFFIGCFFAGIAGSIWAHYINFVHPEQFSLMDSIWQLGMIIVGGMGSITGSILGVLFLKGLEVIATDCFSPWISNLFPSLGATAPQAMGQIVFGLAIVGFLILEPRGLVHQWKMLKSYYQRWPFT
jgi:branched-chain amino acid transport system permease protein